MMLDSEQYQIQLQSMYLVTQHSNDEQNSKEVQIYDSLSSFLKLFRRSVALAQLVASLIQKQQEYSHIIQKIKGVFQELQPLQKENGSVSDPQLIKPHTFNRFSNRLLEIIYLYSSKYKETALSHPYNCFLQCLKELESSIKKYQQSRTLLDIIKSCQFIFVKFCINCKKVAKKSGEESQKKCDQTFQQLKQILIRTRKISPKKVEKKKIYTIDQPQSESESQQEVESVKTTSQSKIPRIFTFNKQVKFIQNRFDTLKCLDLDFSMFRGLYYTVKNNEDQYFKDYLKRNQQNKKLITKYQDDFYLFQRKKTNRQNKRKKLNTLYNKTIGHSSINQIQMLQDIDSVQCNIPEPDFSERILTEQKNEANVSKMMTHQEERFISNDKIKKQLKMNNIQILLGRSKINTMKQVQKNMKEVQKNMKTITKVQPVGFNQSYFGVSISPPKNSFEILQSKIKIPNKRGNVIKTQMNEFQKTENQSKSIFSEKQAASKYANAIGVAIRSKSAFKGKYLEINTRKKKEESERREYSTDNQKMSLKGGQRAQARRRLIFNMV